MMTIRRLDSRDADILIEGAQARAETIGQQHIHDVQNAWTVLFDQLDRLASGEAINPDDPSAPGTPMPYFGEGTVWQEPRWTQLVVTWNF